MQTVNVRLMETQYGDRYIVRDGYLGVDGTWRRGGYETIPGRHDVPSDKIGADRTLWAGDIPTEVYCAIAEAWQVMARKRGGRSRSAAKAAAARANGAKGGRPRKSAEGGAL